jgi:hypothetical protein
MTLADVKNALLGVLPGKVHHNIAEPGEEAPYIVWAEDGQSDSLHGDEIMTDQVIEGTIDLFSKIEYDPLFAGIQTALNDAGIPFRLNYSGYETDTKLFHNEWVWNIETEVA